MGGPLPSEPHKFLQLYLYPLPIVCPLGPNPISSIYSHDEGPRKAIGTRYDMEKGKWRLGLGVFPNSIGGLIVKKTLLHRLNLKEVCKSDKIEKFLE